MKCPWLDGNNVVFGEVVKGRSVIRRIEEFGSEKGEPTKKVVISNCGELHQMMTDKEMEKQI